MRDHLGKLILELIIGQRNRLRARLVMRQIVVVVVGQKTRPVLVAPSLDGGTGNFASTIM